MITYIVGDLLESPAQVLVNTVNTVGIMGKGIAKDFKNIYPEMFEQYQVFCEKELFDIGKLWIYKTSHKWILNFPTKKHWRNKSKLEYIEDGLKKFVDTYDTKGITSISFPKLGCGNGELDWDKQVKPMMEHYLANLPIDIYIHLYEQNNPFAPEHRNIAKIKNWLHSEPQSLGFVEFWEDIIKLVRRNLVFHTMSLENKSEYEIRHNESSNSLIFYTNNSEIVVINQEAFVYLWQYIRSAGYSSPTNLPDGFDSYSDFVIGLITKLDYIRPVLMATNLSEKQEVGLQLVRPTKLFRKPPTIAKPA